MAAYCLLLGSPTVGWYSGIVVLDDVVRGERVLDKLMLNIMHVRNFVEECRKNTVTSTPKTYVIYYQKAVESTSTKGE
jgi:hypothetical protein